MATSPPGSPHIGNRHPQSYASRVERVCWRALTLFPLCFVYGVTTWAAYVEAKIGFQQSTTPFIGYGSSFVGIALYILLNASYTVAVFTDPGSPLKSAGRGNNRGQYTHLPTTELPEYTSYTVNSSGGARFCKKCHSHKPDRTHHCSSCKRCVLKMDHHCPWLATCVGLHNYKAFILFLIYTSVFCWVCFGTGALWTYYEILTDTQYTDSTTPVNVILVTIIGGIIGLVLSGFTAWHLSLAFRNLTTIEALEKTRYLSPLRKTLDRRRFENPLSNRALGESGPGDQSFADRLQDFGNQIIEAHANAIPGVTRAEEGEERPSPSVQNRENERMDGYFTAAELARSRTPAQQSLIQNYGDLERQREIERYEQYLDEQDCEKMPNAFDLGWRQNFIHLFGKNPFLWVVPVCNTIGDGWYWEANPKFLEARERIHKRRLQEWRDWSTQHHQQDRSYNGKALVDNAPFPPQNGHRLETSDRPSTGNTAVSMKTLRPSSRTGAESNSERITSRDSSPNYDTDSDEEPLNDAGRHRAQRHPRHAGDGRSKADRVLGRTPSRVAEEWRDWD